MRGLGDETLVLCPEIITADWASQNIQRRLGLPSGLSGDGAVTRAVLDEIMKSFGADDSIALGAGHVLDDAALTYETYTDFMNRLRFATPDAKTYSTPGTYSLTVPAGVRKITVDAVAGGGGGGSGSYGGGGSSGQGITAREFDVTYGQTLSITVGGGGAVNANGGDTSITGLFAVQGGKAGASNGTAGASSGTGSRAGSAGYTQQVMTSNGGYNVTQGSLYRTVKTNQIDEKKINPNNIGLAMNSIAQQIATLYPETGGSYVVQTLFGNPVQKAPKYYFVVRPYNDADHKIYYAVNTPVSPTYRTDYYKGSGGASVISGYGKGGDGAQAGQAGCVKIDWAKEENIYISNMTISLTGYTSPIVIGTTLSARVDNISPGDATNKSVTWSSSSPSVAQITQDGRITAVGGGSSTIRATAQDAGMYSKTASVYVYPYRVLGVLRDCRFVTNGGLQSTAYFNLFFDNAVPQKINRLYRYNGGANNPFEIAPSVALSRSADKETIIIGFGPIWDMETYMTYIGQTFYYD